MEISNNFELHFVHFCIRGNACIEKVHFAKRIKHDACILSPNTKISFQRSVFES